MYYKLQPTIGNSVNSIISIVILVSMLDVTPLHATHIRGAEITYTRVSDVSLTYEFTLWGYTDVGSPVVFGDGLINFGDGREFQVDLVADSFERGVLVGPRQEVEQYTVKITHTYSSPGEYVVSYKEPNRNDEIININQGNSIGTSFYLQSALVIDDRIGINSSPVMNSLPIDRAFVGVAFTHNPWATDPDGDSLSYRLVFPLQEDRQQVPNYRLPNDPNFYTEFVTGNEDDSGPPTFELNPLTGNLTWDAPGESLSNSQGAFSEYNVAFIVEEWREVEGRWWRIGYVTRDMLITVNRGADSRPDIQVPENIDLSMVETVNETATYTDPEQRQILPEFFATAFNLPNEPMTVSPEITTFTPIPINVNFTWNVQPEHIIDRPYLIHLKATTELDQSNEFTVVNYRTWILSNGELRSVQAPSIAMPPRTAIVTSLREFGNEHIAKLYPNPVSDQLYWETTEIVGQIKSIRIINIASQETNFHQISSYSMNSFPVHNLVAGVYLVHLLTRKSSYWGKFIKN